MLSFHERIVTMESTKRINSPLPLERDADLADPRFLGEPNSKCCSENRGRVRLFRADGSEEWGISSTLCIPAMESATQHSSLLTFSVNPC